MWRIRNQADLPRPSLDEFLRPAIRSAPRSLKARLPGCRINLVHRLESADAASEWVRDGEWLDITVASDGVEAHDLALETLLCVGQALWESTIPAEREAWLKVLAAEIDAATPGEIDEDALREKLALLTSHTSARSGRRLERYARAAFAGTVAEYVHCLWHDVTIRTGPDHLPAPWLRRRLELLARWFPPERGRRVFAAGW